MRKSKLPAEPIIGLLKQPLLHTRSWMRLNYQFQLLQWMSSRVDQRHCTPDHTDPITTLVPGEPNYLMKS